MFQSTLQYLRCARRNCGNSELELKTGRKQRLAAGVDDVVAGSVSCSRCGEQYPILSGVLCLIENPEDYLLAHIKGISREVPEADFPKKFRSAMIQAKRQIETEHIEEDLESERVTSLYFMTHYLRASGDWWKSIGGSSSPAIEELIRRYWDHGPFENIRAGIEEEYGNRRVSMVELGCGVGGLFVVLSKSLQGYLGVDNSFASIALARKIALGAGEKLREIRIPSDLIQGTVSRDVLKLLRKDVANRGSQADFIVSDASAPSLRPAQWDVCASLNMIDMLERPEELPGIQKSLIGKDGLAIESSPYVWHPDVARDLRKRVGKDSADSAVAVERLYERAGFRIEKSIRHVPWLFFKHSRQIELYSVHLLFARARALQRH